MRWWLLSLVLVGGCDDAAYYADGSVWEAVVPLEPGRVAPADMNARQWSHFVSQAGIQADAKVKTFTPEWVGFSVDPVGDISYYDFGAIVVMWTDVALVGTSNATVMAITNLPDQIQTTSGAMISSFMSDNGTGYTGLVGVETTVSRQINFYLSVVSSGKVSYDLSAFTTSGNKGLSPGWLIVYPKAR